MDKSLARQVFPPGLVGDLIYRASQMMPQMNAFASRMMPQPQPIQQQPPMAAPQQVQAGQQMQPNPDMMPQQPAIMQRPADPGIQQGGQFAPQMHPGIMPMQQPQPQMQQVGLPPNQNIFSQRMVRY